MVSRVCIVYHIKQRNMRLSALKVLGALAIFDPVPSALECTENVEH